MRNRLLLLFAVVGLVAGAAGQDFASLDYSGGQFQWGKTNLVARGGWGRMIPLTDGEWLGVSTRFGRGESSLEILHCNNVAGPWDKLAEVKATGRLLDNGELIRLPDGVLLLTGRSLINGQSYRLPVYRSLDQGRTWTEFGNIDANEGPPGSLAGRGLWEPHFFRLADGRLAVAYANEKHAAGQPAFSQVCSERISADGGKTWGDEILVAAERGGGKLRPGMPVITRMANGKFIAVYEVVGVGDADVFGKISVDGVHWPDGLGRRVEHHHAGPWVVSLANGDLLITSCANIISRSRDFGVTWDLVGPVPWQIGGGKVFTWPALYEISTNRIASMISWRGVRIRVGLLRDH